MAYLYDSKSPERITQPKTLGGQRRLSSFTLLHHQIKSNGNQAQSTQGRRHYVSRNLFSFCDFHVRFNLIWPCPIGEEISFFSNKDKTCKVNLNWNDKFPVSEELARVCYTKLSCLIILQVHITLAQPKNQLWITL
jgi:hypothetical protein